MNWKQFWEQVTNWELWPFTIRYFLITPVWGWYCLRSGSLWFFSASNPTLTFGGFEGEGKKEMYDQLPAGTFPKTIYIHPHENFESVKEKLVKHQFSYPFVAKPDVSMKGLLFRKIDKEQQLNTYHQQVPAEYIIQDLVTFPLEVSVFYYRFPDKEKGVITGFIQKDLMEVVGDGRSTLLQLIILHPKARHRLDEMKIKHEENLEKILDAGEKYFLTYAANLNRGATFTSLHHLIDEELHILFDKLSHHASFYYGRYDIKCTSIEDLKKGKNYCILEFNGSGAEPNHVYNAGLTLFQAYKEILRHWKVLYKISRYNHKNGVPYWSFNRGRKFLREAKRHLRILEECDNKIAI